MFFLSALAINDLIRGGGLDNADAAAAEAALNAATSKHAGLPLMLESVGLMKAV